MNRHATILSALLFTCLTGCAVGPNFERPEIVADDVFFGREHLPQPTDSDHRGADTPEAAPSDSDRAQNPTAEIPRSLPPQWWEGFQDDALSKLIVRALEVNHDLSIAAARLRRARAERGLAARDLFPGTQLKGNYEESEISAIRAPGVPNRRTTLYEVGFDASWELDLWGRIRRQVEAAYAHEAAQEFNLVAVRHSVVTEVIRNYVELRELQERIGVARATADAQRETVRLTERQFALGLITELDAARARAELHLTESTVPPLMAQADGVITVLSVLTDTPAGDLFRTLQVHEPLPVLKIAFQLDDPAAMLRRRPEVLRAERELARATAEVGVAEGENFPKVQLLGSLTWEADTFSSLDSNSTRVYGFGPRITWQGLDRARIGKIIGKAQAAREEAEARYRKTVREALGEVEQALSAYGNARAQTALLEVAYEESSKALQLSRRQYEAGAVDLLTVLDSERRTLVARDQLAQSKARAVKELVATIKALGIPTGLEVG